MHWVNNFLSWYWFFATVFFNIVSHTVFYLFFFVVCYFYSNPSSHILAPLNPLGIIACHKYDFSWLVHMPERLTNILCLCMCIPLSCHGHQLGPDWVQSSALPAAEAVSTAADPSHPAGVPPWPGGTDDRPNESLWVNGYHHRDIPHIWHQGGKLFMLCLRTPWTYLYM